MAYTNVLRHPGGARAAARGLHQHHADRPLSRRRQAGGGLRDGAAGRHRRARDEDRSDRSCAGATTSSPAPVPYKTPFTRGARQRQLRSGDGHGGARRRLERLRQAPRGVEARTASCAGAASPTSWRSAAPFNDRMEIRFDENGTRHRSSPAPTTTARATRRSTPRWSSEWLGVDFHSIRMIQGDTDQVGFGRGTYGSRSMTIGGSALKHAADVLIEKAKKMAGHVLEASAGDIAFADGKFTVVGTDKSIALVDLAKRSFAPVGWPAEFGVGLEAVGTFTPTRSNFAERLPHLRGRGRSRHRQGRDRALHRGRRFRRHHQSAAVRGPDPRRHRHGHRPGADGERRVRSVVRAAAVRLVPWTTACRAPRTCRTSTCDELADRCQQQSDRREGRGRIRHGRRAAGDHRRHRRCAARLRRDRHPDAGDVRAGLAGDAGAPSAAERIERERERTEWLSSSGFSITSIAATCRCRISTRTGSS